MSADLPAAVVEALARIPGARIRSHLDFAGPIRSPADFAAALGYAPERIVKTLFLAERTTPRPRRLQAPQAHYAGAALSANRKLDMRAAAGALGWSGCEVASTEELEAVAGFPRWGVSPLGLPTPVLLDEALMAHETILVGGGLPGVEIELAPRLLAEATEAKVAALAVAA